MTARSTSEACCESVYRAGYGEEGAEAALPLFCESDIFIVRLPFYCVLQHGYGIAYRH